MTTVSELQARVESAYAGLTLPRWPNPHPGMTSPRDEEYSRVTDPERYRIVHVRGRVWADVLGEALGAEPESLEPVPRRAVGSAWFDRGVRLVSRGRNALPLLLLERDVPMEQGQPSSAVLEVAVARPDVVVERQPDCGCDACDFGSGQLLEAVDEAILRVVGGPFVALRGTGWHAEWCPDGGSAGSEGARRLDYKALMDACRRLSEGEEVRLPRGTEAFTGRSWLD